ncbi:MAG: hypothetical protein RI953_734 [Pseudomonadota bacterium]
MRSYLLPAVAAIFLAVGPMACSSSGEESPSPALEGAASGEEAASGNAAANGANASGDNAAAVNANTESSNTAKPEGEAAAANNPIGNELNNAIANDKGEGASNDSAAPVDGGAINAEANGNVGAAGDANPATADSAAADSAPAATAADANASNPFASASNSSTVPANAAPVDPSVGAAPMPSDAGAATAAPADSSAALAPAAPAAGETASASSSSAVATGPTALPEMGSKMAYYVMRGDTLGAIAQKIFGSRKKWKALQTENGLADANKIYPGDVIYFTLDESSKAFAEKYEIGNRQAYTIAKGDTLAGLAAKFYGTQGAWRALWKENPQILNPDRIRVGMVLSYRSTSKVAFKDEREDEGEVKQDEQETANSNSDEGTVAMDEGGAVQFTAAAE